MAEKIIRLMQQVPNKNKKTLIAKDDMHRTKTIIKVDQIQDTVSSYCACPQHRSVYSILHPHPPDPSLGYPVMRTDTVTFMVIIDDITCRYKEDEHQDDVICHHEQKSNEQK